MRRMVLHVKAAAGDEMVVEFLLVFDGLDAKKDGTKSKGGDEENADELLLADLGRPDGHGHGQAAHDKDNGVAGAQFDVKSVAANAEGGAESAPIDGVSEEHAAEEQDFGKQEDPHAERGGFLLLLKGLKMSVQLSGAVHAVLLFAIQRMTCNYSQRGRDKPRPCKSAKRFSHLHEQARAMALLLPSQDRGGSESRMAPR